MIGSKDDRLCRLVRHFKPMIIQESIIKGYLNHLVLFRSFWKLRKHYIKFIIDQISSVYSIRESIHEENNVYILKSEI